ncbi:hypothetical protein TELCIR_21282, partial [Teladorsagia circumcincta]
EYWAVFEVMVHLNANLNETEKMILLKESLVGKAATTIKGIKMIPQNYSWMVDVIKKKYDNLTTTRANVIKRLMFSIRQKTTQNLAKQFLIISAP